MEFNKGFEKRWNSKRNSLQPAKSAPFQEETGYNFRSTNLWGAMLVSRKDIHLYESHMFVCIYNYIYKVGGASASLIVRPKTAPRTIYKIYRTIYKSSGLL